MILQLRPEDPAAEQEYGAFLKYGGLQPHETERIRMEKGVRSVNLENFSAIIIGGGPWNVSDSDEKKSWEQKIAETWLSQLIRDAIAQDASVLGACYGFGAIAQTIGNSISKKQYSEPAGAIDVELTPDGLKDPLLSGLSSTFRAMVGHKEACQQLPDGAVWLAKSSGCPYQMFRIKQNIYATQFHPELETDGLCLRIDIYKHAGYFPPEDAEALKTAAQKEHITVPMEILKRFVERYRQ